MYLNIMENNYFQICNINIKKISETIQFVYL